MTKQVLVIGKNGQLAQELLNLPETPTINLTAIGRPKCDISDPDKLAEIFKTNHYDLVINASAYTAVDKAESEQEIAYQINAHGVRNLARLCQNEHIPLIHISTDYVFDGTGDYFHSEAEETNPINVYGASKLEGEKAISELLTNYVILRTSWVYSAYCNNFIKTMLKLGAIKNELNIIDDQVGGPTYAKDLAVAVLKIAETILNGKEDGFGIFNYCGKEPTSWYGFACEIFKIASQYGQKVPEKINPITTKEYPTPAKRPANSKLDCNKIAKVYGITQNNWQVSTAECIKLILAQQGEIK